MTDILLEPLPTVWEGRAIDPDFRPMVWLNDQFLRGHPKKDPQGIAQEAFRRFYRDPIPPLEAPDAWESLLRFFIFSEPPTGSGRGGAAAISFDYASDADYIMAAFLQAYRIDLTTERVHWWRFRALFRALPEDTLMAKIISWRTMDLTDLDGKTRQLYEDRKEAFALPRELTGNRPAVTVADHNAAFAARFRRNDPDHPKVR